jgi:hypothetical protein
MNKTVREFEEFAKERCLDIDKLSDTNTPIYLSLITNTALGAWLASKEKYENKTE